MPHARGEGAVTQSDGHQWVSMKAPVCVRRLPAFGTTIRGKDKRVELSPNDGKILRSLRNGEPHAGKFCQPPYESIS